MRLLLPSPSDCEIAIAQAINREIRSSMNEPVSASIKRVRFAFGLEIRALLLKHELPAEQLPYHVVLRRAKLSLNPDASHDVVVVWREDV